MRESFESLKVLAFACKPSLAFHTAAIPSFYSNPREALSPGRMHQCTLARSSATGQRGIRTLDRNSQEETARASETTCSDSHPRKDLRYHSVSSVARTISCHWHACLKHTNPGFNQNSEHAEHPRTNTSTTAAAYRDQIQAPTDLAPMTVSTSQRVVRAVLHRDQLSSQQKQYAGKGGCTHTRMWRTYP